MWPFIYRIGIALLHGVISVAALKNDKAKKRIIGADNFELQWQRCSLTSEAEKRYWFHCASLGEFDAMIPVFSKLKSEQNCQIVVSFFSPSGFEKRSQHELVDAAFYLPWDTPTNARKIVEMIRPDVAVFVKYEFWLHFFRTLRAADVPLIVAGVRFAEKNAYFGLLSGLYRPIFKQISLFLTQDQQSAELLQAKGYPNTICIGDTRIDQCLQTVTRQKAFPDLPPLIAGRKVWIIGSTWPEDERVWIPAWKNLDEKPFLIVAPHEVLDKRLIEIERKLDTTICRWSQIKQMQSEETPSVLLVDTIGDLPYLYRYADIAYIGGAFGKGLHNILEPLAFKIPVLFGTDIRRFPEAREAQKLGFALSVRDEETLIQGYRYFMSTPAVKQRIQKYLSDHAGASDRVVSYIRSANTKTRV